MQFYIPKKILFLSALFLILLSCKSERALSDNEIYGFLATCFADYYKDYQIQIIPFLNHFEQQLIEEGQLKDSSGTAYKELFKDLDENTYFKAPQKVKTFNKIILLKNPKNILSCASKTFSIDSSRIANLPFAHIQREMNQHLTTNDSVSVHYFFKTYEYQLNPTEYRKPYIKQTLLIFLYRWYYQSAQQKIKEEDNKPAL